MQVTLIDSSHPFDGETSQARPLGGAEKAFAGLATALAARGHEVVAINQCDYQRSVAGVDWLPWNTPRPPEVDVLIAFRKPELLDEVPHAGRHVMWVWGSPRHLNRPANQTILDRRRPTLAFVSDHQKRSWKPWRDFSQKVIRPGLVQAYLENPDDKQLDQPPIAVMTTHPKHGMEEIIRLWREGIHPDQPEAELHIYSASLHRAMIGDVPGELGDPVFQAARDAPGVVIKAPLGDGQMARVYEGARLHIYPPIGFEIYCSTLAESQACGLPALVGPMDGNQAPAVGERMHDGRTGYLAPDGAALINLARQLLADDQIYGSLSRDAKTLQGQRGWDVAAIEFEKLWDRG